jgi:hypothetical protein
MIKGFKILAVTYFITFTIGVISLFVLSVPVSILCADRRSGFEWFLPGFIINLFMPGLLCGLVFLPIIVKDEAITAFSVSKLITRVLPFVLIPIAIVLCCFVLGGIMYGMGPYIFFYFYFISITSLYVFCRTLKYLNE